MKAKILANHEMLINQFRISLFDMLQTYYVYGLRYTHVVRSNMLKMPKSLFCYSKKLNVIQKQKEKVPFDVRLKLCFPYPFF